MELPLTARTRLQCRRSEIWHQTNTPDFDQKEKELVSALNLVILALCKDGNFKLDMLKTEHVSVIKKALPNVYKALENKKLGSELQLLWNGAVPSEVAKDPVALSLAGSSKSESEKAPDVPKQSQPLVPVGKNPDTVAEGKPKEKPAGSGGNQGTPTFRKKSPLGVEDVPESPDKKGPMSS